MDGGRGALGAIREVRVTSGLPATDGEPWSQRRRSRGHSSGGSCGAADESAAGAVVDASPAPALDVGHFSHGSMSLTSQEMCQDWRSISVGCDAERATGTAPQSMGRSLRSRGDPAFPEVDEKVLGSWQKRAGDGNERFGTRSYRDSGVILQTTKGPLAEKARTGQWCGAHRDAREPRVITAGPPTGQNDASGACAAAGGTWVNGKCMRVGIRGSGVHGSSWPSEPERSGPSIADPPLACIPRRAQ